MSFDAYVELLFTTTNRHEETEEQHLQTLQQGCYTVYLEHYFNRFGPERVHILFYEKLAAQPADTMAKLCDFAGIDAGFYGDYGFKVTNRTQQMRNSELHRKYRDFRFRLRQWTHDKPIIHIPLRSIRRTIEPLYLRLNAQTDAEDAGVRRNATPFDRLLHVGCSGARRIDWGIDTMENLGKIQLMIVGAQKAGTSSLLRYLAQHPDIHTHAQPEMTFFLQAREYTRGYEWAFGKYFTGQNSHDEIQDKHLIAKNVMVMHSPEVMQRIYEHNPEIHLVVLLREPVARAYSAYWWARRRGWENIKTYEEALAAEETRLNEGWFKWRQCAYQYNGIYYPACQEFDNPIWCQSRALRLN